MKHQPLIHPATMRDSRMTVGFIAMLLGLLILAGFSTTASAQSVRFKSAVSRLTVPPSFSGTMVISNVVTLSGVSSPVDLSVSGLPSGVSVAITAGSGLALPLDGGFPSTAISTNILMTFTFSSPANGTYPLALNGASGAVNLWPFVLQVSPTWASPSNNYTGSSGGAAGLWSASGSWANSQAPAAGDDVVFDNTTAESAVVTNIVVDNSPTIGSLRFSQTNNTVAYHVMLINPGQTLSITGSNGFSMLRDYAPLTSAKSFVTIAGGGNAMMLVSNETANFAVQSEGNTLFTLNMTNLDNLKVDVSRVALGDYQTYPYFQNYVISNQYGDVISKFAPAVNLARTNNIKSVYADPNNYTNGPTRSYGICLGNNYGGGSGSSPALQLYFGITNSIYADGICFAHAGCQAPNVGFNPVFSSVSPSALFRGTNGGRMSIMALADFAGFTNIASGSSPKSTVNFLAGTIDVQVDRFYMSLDRYNTGSGATPSSTFNMGLGTFDCNTAILGYESNGSHTNTGSCQATLLVSNGTFTVNNSLTLGYTTDAAGSAGAPQGTWGKVTINGGKLYVSNVLVGGVSKASVGNNITITNGALMVISNQIAGSDKMLDNFNVYNSTITMNLDGALGVPVIYSTNFFGSGATLTVASIKNIPGSLLIPLFAWNSANSPSFTLVPPIGFNATMVADPSVANQIDLQIITNAPKTIVWNGYASADWDNTTANWLDTATLLHTNFAAGDKVIFDDTATVTNINLISTAYILPGSMTMTNSTKNYIFNNTGGGSIVGSSSFNKYGTGSVEIDPVAASVTVNVNAGSLICPGTVNGVNVSSGATLNASGTLNGGLTCFGVATIASGGTVAGALNIQTGGAVTNAGTLNGSLSVAANCVLYNDLTGNLTAFGTASIGTNSFVLNRGQMKGNNITVNAGGIFEDTGETSQGIKLDGALTISGRATFIPGGDGIGTTTIGYYGTAADPRGRVAMSANSTNIFKVDAFSGTCTHLNANAQYFGGSQNTKAVNGCVIEIINTNTSVAYTGGQSFHFFGNPDNGGAPYTLYLATLNTTNTYPLVYPGYPANGQGWDVSGVFTTGNIAVTTVSPIPTNIVFVPTMGTLMTTNSTNNVIINQFNWPSDHTGWRLQSLTTTMDVGMTATNWTDVFGSTWANSMTITNTIVTNNAVFYRMIYP